MNTNNGESINLKREAILKEHEECTGRVPTEQFVFWLDRLLRYDGVPNRILYTTEIGTVITQRGKLDEVQDMLNKHTKGLPRGKDGSVKVYEPRVIVDEDNVIRVQPIGSSAQ